MPPGWDGHAAERLAAVVCSEAASAIAAIPDHMKATP
jgi:hypothetical protein